LTDIKKIPGYAVQEIAEQLEVPHAALVVTALAFAIGVAAMVVLNVSGYQAVNIYLTMALIALIAIKGFQPMLVAYSLTFAGAWAIFTKETILTATQKTIGWHVQVVMWAMIIILMIGIFLSIVPVQSAGNAGLLILILLAFAVSNVLKGVDKSGITLRIVRLVLIIALLATGWNMIPAGTFTGLKSVTKITAVTAPDPASEAMVADSVMTDVPAEGLLVTIAPGTKVISFTVPKDTIGFRNYIPTASVDEINRGSWMDYLVQGPRTGERESLIVKPGLTEAITVMVDPFTATEALEENTANN
jgi:hypothetical protein